MSALKNKRIMTMFLCYMVHLAGIAYGVWVLYSRRDRLQYYLLYWHLVNYIPYIIIFHEKEKSSKADQKIYVYPSYLQIFYAQCHLFWLWSLIGPESIAPWLAYGVYYFHWLYQFL